MEPNDKMIIDEEMTIHDIEDIGKRNLMLSNNNNLHQISDMNKEAEIENEDEEAKGNKVENENEDEEIDEDINHNYEIKREIEKVEEDINANNTNTNNNKEMIIDGEPQTKVIIHKKEKNSLMRFPLAKIKNTIKLDDDIKLCQKNAYFVIGKMTELFLQELAKNSLLICKMSKRKTLNIDDINTAIKGKDKYAFIDMASIFHIDIIGSNNAKEKKGKKTINQSTLTPESNALIKTPSIPHSMQKENAKAKANKDKSNKPKKEKAKQAPKKTECSSNKKIDQMFSK